MLNRRGLITGLISFVAAPAIVRVSSLMPVKSYDNLWSKITPYSPISDVLIDRLDILYGWRKIHPEWPLD